MQFFLPGSGNPPGLWSYSAKLFDHLKKRIRNGSLLPHGGGAILSREGDVGGFGEAGGERMVMVEAAATASGKECVNEDY